MKPNTVQFQGIALERAKVAARASLSPQVAHDMRSDVIADQMTDRLVMQLSTYVMRERLLTDDQSASFTREVEFEHKPRWLVGPPALLTVALGIAAMALGSLPLILAAIGIAALGVCLYVVNPAYTDRKTVSGTVTIPVTSYATFPKNTHAYPDSLGAMVRVMEPGLPYWEWDR